MDTCRQCGRTLPEQADRGRARIYCDRSCARAWHRALRDQQRTEQEAGRTCAAPDCEESLAGRRSTVLYCSESCRRRARPPRRVVDPKPRGGSPGPRPRARRYHSGDRLGDLVLVEYVDPDASGSRCLFACDCGNRVELALRNVTSGATQRCNDRDQHPDPRQRGEAITAGTRHQQLARRHGSAGTRPCVACGVIGRGNQYAYLHSTPDEVTQLTGKNRGQVYSHDDGDYAVMCRKHHAGFDAAHRRYLQPGELSGFHVALGALLRPVNA